MSAFERAQKIYHKAKGSNCLVQLRPSLFFFSLFQTRTDCTSPTGAPYAERKQLLKGKIPRLFFWELRLSSSFTLPVGGAARVFILVLKARAQTPFFLLVLPKRPPPLLTVRGWTERTRKGVSPRSSVSIPRAGSRQTSADKAGWLHLSCRDQSVRAWPVAWQSTRVRPWQVRALVRLEFKTFLPPKSVVVGTRGYGQAPLNFSLYSTFM